MLKKLYYLLLLLTNSAFLFSMQSTDLQIATKAVLREYQKQVAILKKIESLNPTLYAQVMTMVEKILNNASQDFTTKLNNAIEEQYNAIVNQNMPFSATKYPASLEDLAPNAPSMNKYFQAIFSAVVNRNYFQALWQKLSQKEQTSAPVVNPETQNIAVEPSYTL